MIDLQSKLLAAAAQAAAAGDVAHAIRTLAETPLTAGQITIAVMEKRREIANAPAIEGET